MRHDGPAEAVLEELSTLTVGNWLFRGFASLSGTSVITDFHQQQEPLNTIIQSQNSGRR